MSGWLTVDQLNCDRFYGVPAAFLGDDCESAVAVTDDWRRGGAAIHAMFRKATGMPVRSGRVEVVWARFYPLPEEYQDCDAGDWVMSPCDQSTEGAIRVVLAQGTESYSPVPSGGDPDA